MRFQGERQRAKLARSVTLSVLRLPNKRLQWMGLRADAEPER